MTEIDYGDFKVRLTEARLETVDVYNEFVELVADEAGRLYLLGFCDGADPEEGYESLWLALPLSERRLQELEESALTLKDAYLEPEEGELAMAVFYPDGRAGLNFLPPDKVFFQFLPGRVPLRRRPVERRRR